MMINQFLFLLLLLLLLFLLLFLLLLLLALFLCLFVVGLGCVCVCVFVCLGNGYIPTSSLREILGALDDNLTSEQLDGIIQEIDTDGSGTVDFDGKSQRLAIIL